MRGARALSILAASAVAVVGCEPYPGSTGTSASASSSGAGTSGGSGEGGGSGSSRRPINAEKLCSRLVNECKQATTEDACRRQFVAVLVTGTCADALSAATCAELLAPRSIVLDTCFPPCGGTLASCNGDGSITICTSAGTTNVLDCEDACRADGNRAYSGTCGLSFGAQVSNAPQCWCQ